MKTLHPVVLALILILNQIFRLNLNVKKSTVISESNKAELICRSFYSRNILM